MHLAPSSELEEMQWTGVNASSGTQACQYDFAYMAANAFAESKEAAF